MKITNLSRRDFLGIAPRVLLGALFLPWSSSDGILKGLELQGKSLEQIFLIPEHPREDQLFDDIIVQPGVNVDSTYRNVVSRMCFEAHQATIIDGSRIFYKRRGMSVYNLSAVMDDKMRYYLCYADVPKNPEAQTASNRGILEELRNYLQMFIPPNEQVLKEPKVTIIPKTKDEKNLPDIVLVTGESPQGVETPWLDFEFTPGDLSLLMTDDLKSQRLDVVLNTLSAASKKQRVFDIASSGSTIDLSSGTIPKKLILPDFWWVAEDTNRLEAKNLRI